MTNRQQGFGLPELLISLLLASFIILALVNQYLHAKNQHRYAYYAAGQGLELQAVVDLMRDSIRRAGFTPCRSINQLISMDRRSEHKNLQGIEIQQKKQAHIHIQRMSEYFDLIVKINNPIELLTHKPMFKPNQTVLIADCVHAEVQQVHAIQPAGSGQVVILSQPLAFNYQKPVFIGEWLHERFYIHNNKQEQNALFYQFERADELTSYVQAMQAHLKQAGKHQMLSVVLRTTHGKDMGFTTLVRS
ncbi:prepilin-type N-terminal cleavage/methylation domain-containing protein [Legionella oakridgensis]|uniref:Tfp pilus assembly protein PilW n=2 Tax=Legionella oakridgensis TaxID=29423 RepID=W0BD44_9GAMM|nr:prepilin-type N-terminal cleavage/methylation domain-containing protein [Legionella oakridgensis]AHE66621.1 hypothetical protein Loa_01065 [Legionella oakridgensis ATCC 33761 = DSM 21215]ETO93638.1 hypothetical protein LOR_100c25540 [Legionella oakridgensis RV-2-2007]KTD37784.1 hypothetical protein Loak_1460 [Legionella oakridgensis]STY19764.1 Tfp pilus assembly protein PilW [Legionella longbeachae]